MADTRELDDPTVDEEEFEDPAVRDDDFDRLFGIAADGVIGAAGGLVGTTLMTVVLLIGESFDVFSRSSFATVTSMVGLDGVFPEVTAGYVLFVLAGMFPWPLLFASLKEYLPGARDPVHGIVFGTALWTGFVFAFYDGYTGLALVGYLAVTLVAHWVYGIGLGAVFEYLATRPDTLV
ncbi:DUF6789 family protein [Halosimplex aquaticum]|uniref:DUF6789 family protein n=1 Tax=Halosimplex aquaticum TaxID=3026162 RepID=A0ABD5Y4E9_9EURY|nr:DUF6789 family protein [Halosimplex aquaticum]